MSVLGLLLAGGIGIISSTQTWLTVARADGGEPILVPGADALPLLAPLSLAMLALGAALALVGPVLRYVFSTLALLGGGLLTWWTARSLSRYRCLRLHPSSPRPPVLPGALPSTM
ncbi:Trp biosynthesis-associated membrane protein [Microbacterium sp. CH12i]|uniref:Trp biosynthesis-associated membrane protein n=1 Tax=Microbacterium sp. CH12i TaxID=1479651 RepID=UPI002286012A|nr:Trp biosynthesis-associated membrane protein [Microbacterium sp. CH12i]